MGGGSETILITGGYGFIGRNLISHFLDRSYRLVIVDAGRREDSDEFGDVVDYTTDMSEPAVLRDIVSRENPDFVIHLAGLVTASRYRHDIDDMISSNSIPLLNVLKALESASRLRLFINFGSAEEYGPIKIPFSEDMHEHPQSPYALAKLHNTLTTAYLADQEGIPAITLRPGLVYGPHQPVDKFLPSVILAALKGVPVVMTPGHQTRDPVFAPDLARIVELFLKHPFTSYGGIYNAAQGREIQLIDIVKQIIEITDSGSRIDTSLPYRKREAMRFVCDMSKTIGVIGEDFTWTPLSEGLNRTINYYRELASEK
ncbi:MAG: NAD-dependent epimerase/dehydratase family protein [Pseudomonadota bacterium]|jgi:nucleoside-diphosphate-sugar epimerase